MPLSPLEAHVLSKLQLGQGAHKELGELLEKHPEGMARDDLFATLHRATSAKPDAFKGMTGKQIIERIQGGIEIKAELVRRQPEAGRGGQPREEPVEHELPQGNALPAHLAGALGPVSSAHVGRLLEAAQRAHGIRIGFSHSRPLLEQFREVSKHLPSLRKDIPFLSAEMHERATEDLHSILADVVKLNKRLHIADLPNDPAKITPMHLVPIQLWMLEKLEGVTEMAEKKRPEMEGSAADLVNELYGLKGSVRIRQSPAVPHDEKKFDDMMDKLQEELDEMGSRPDLKDSKQMALLHDFFAHGAAINAERNVVGAVMERGAHPRAKELASEMGDSHRLLPDHEAMFSLFTHLSHYLGVVHLQGKAHEEDIPAGLMGSVVGYTNLGGEKKTLPATQKQIAETFGQYDARYSWMTSLVHELGELAGHQVADKLFGAEWESPEKLHQAYSMVYGPVVFNTVSQELEEHAKELRRRQPAELAHREQKKLPPR